ncbi:DNA methyltransferase [Tranquillimonas alkanivorans]|uniref:Methyltransferase n=1 Tax=Tranquillimonas alkanivorans TaxID=441119 RepID=A0A1I5WP75_9RHOB|nr:DNA methyltransferase [Tranquillimonas alkanivorans]SFQ21582.1 DNA methylase [Tranquillimonas alkanivorans]
MVSDSGFIKERVIGDCRLILGDSREIVSYLEGYDAVITDPVWPNAPQGMFPGVDNPRDLLEDVLAHCTEAQRIAIIMRCDSDPRILSAVPECLPFVRVQMLEYAVAGRMGRILGGMETLYGYGKPIPVREGQRLIPGRCEPAQPTKKADRPDHPCPRSLHHMKWAVRWWSEPGETVLDPFMGSGTTLAACAALGRAAVGIEIDPDYFEIACGRIEEAYRQPDLFDALLRVS